jgi:hypothetical protein
VSAPQLPTRFHGSVSLDATRVGRDAGRIADEVVSHLTALVGSDVKVTLEIEAQNYGIAIPPRRTPARLPSLENSSESCREQPPW